MALVTGTELRMTVIKRFFISLHLLNLLDLLFADIIADD